MQSTKSILVKNSTVVITLSGSSGTANVTGIGGLTKLATFDSDLETTADNFVTDHAAAYLAVGIVVTAASGVLTFKASESDSGFGAAMITNTGTGNLSGTLVITSEKIYVGGAKRIGLQLRRADHAAGSSAFSVKASLDKEDTVTPTMTAFNLLNDNAANTNTQNITRVNGKTLSADGDAFLEVDPVALINWIEIAIINTTDGTSTTYLLLEY
jgi:hypothetical protein